jgi:hypothetical protein
MLREEGKLICLLKLILTVAILDYPAQ